MADNTSHWKQKYYDSLDDFEQREEKWKALEEIFKQAISRLSLAAEGNSKSLDDNLVQLRTAIRKGKDNRVIQSILENVSQEIIRLDSQVKAGPVGDAGFLLKIIEQMRLSGRSEKKSRGLLKKLNGKKPPEQKELIQLFSELLEEVIKQAIKERDQNNNGGGFLKNFFRQKEAVSSNDNVPHDTAVNKTELPSDTANNDNQEVPEEDSVNLNQEQLTSVVATVQNVLESIIDGFDIDESIKEQLKDKIFELRPTREIHVLLDDLSHILKHTGMMNGLTDMTDKGIEYHELLIRLIEFLPLEEKFKAKAEQLKDNFSQGVSTEQLPDALKSIAALISEMRSSVQQEQKEFETFLKNLSGRLQEVDKYLESNLLEHQQSYQNGINLDNAVKEGVKDIGNSVASIDNLEDMTRAISDHMDKIVAHIDIHREQEDERYARIESQNQSLSRQLKEMESEASQLRKQVLESQNKALIDPLTQLPNRLAYDQRMKQEFARWKRYNSTLLIMVWDIDFFKQVNDTYGHQAGDKVLKVVGNILRQNLRETDFIARFGGEEFVSLMPETTLGGGFKVADKIRSMVEKLEFHYRGNNVKVTISCGISLFMENDTPETAFARADNALYQAKEQGRNRCVIAKEP
jgi:diguanylate cyclase